MATAVLPPQGCLKDRFRESPMTCSLNSSRSGRSRTRSGRRRRSPGKDEGNVHGKQLAARAPSADLVMEKVYILKRGETLAPVGVPSPKKNENHKGDEILPVYSTERIGPDPDLVPIQIRLRDLWIRRSSDEILNPYAGAAFQSSPSPRSVPVPAFFKKSVPRLEDLATNDLRRILQLEF